jgi:pimeloyl-ACP methyl ester carboxylesterase
MTSGAVDETLLLIHGLGATGRVWDGWRPLLDEHWPGRWLAPDLPGHGSAAPLPSYGFGSIAAAVAASLPTAERFVVVGHSLGGVIGLELATGRYGVQVDRAVTLGVKVSWTREELDKAAALAQREVQWFDTRADAAARSLRVAGLQGLLDPDDEAIDHGLCTEDGRWRLALDPATFGVGAPDLPSLLRASRAKIVLARGELDRMNTDAELHALHNRVATLPGLGHNAHAEDPEAVANVVRET